MITKGELKTLEQETRFRWLGLLVLTVKMHRFPFVKEPGSPEGGLIRNILQGTEDKKTPTPATKDKKTPTPATEDKKTPTPATEDKKTPTPAVVLLLTNAEEATSLAEAIQADGIVPRTVSSPQEAYALTADENVRVFVVDEGFIKTTTDTWRFRKDKVIPVAVIGSSPEREGWDRVVQLDADAYLSKGISRAEQVARIKALFRRA